MATYPDTVAMTKKCYMIFHQGRMYLADDNQPEVFDPLTNTWSNWTRPPTTMCFSCLVSWNNYIFQFGGNTPVYSRQVQKYDPSTDKWTNISTKPPFDIYRSGCVTLPNGNILIVGSMATSATAYTEYDVVRNVWSPVIHGKVLEFDSTPLVLGSRVFVIPPSGPKPVEEYIYGSSSLSFSALNLSITTFYKPAAVAVPARWFSHIPGGCYGIK